MDQYEPAQKSGWGFGMAIPPLSNMIISGGRMPSLGRCASTGVRLKDAAMPEVLRNAMGAGLVYDPKRIISKSLKVGITDHGGSPTFFVFTFETGLRTLTSQALFNRRREIIDPKTFKESGIIQNHKLPYFHLSSVLSEIYL